MNAEKKQYESPQAEILMQTFEDIIVASGNAPGSIELPTIPIDIEEA